MNPVSENALIGFSKLTSPSQHSTTIHIHWELERLGILKGDYLGS